MIDTLKIQVFEYLVFRLLEWYNESSSGKGNDLSVLKVLKLTFFISAVGTNRDSDNTLLDNVFDNYVAMPYGHVESDIYTFIKSNKLVNTSINNRETNILDSMLIGDFDSSLRKQIDNSVSLLKSINYDLINLSSFELVDLSHTWYSWQKYYSIAKECQKNSEPIPTDVIKNEDKIYQL
ncbi:conserved hypothetical protein [Tenacibaculum maritimum]|uniref:hypothetical protein n=1 Tax=Tenacibaculum maritimum TaxID=107401 RepID=UPI0012E42AE2|nr:hypothetical protein [Tenacibaculum maritimum]CAA0143766.1 conserved hypothetical protein [Tenacibaculum maritimum]CAA0144411.1 conserved hypothetical protein [Tenacibaculum maritimum]CAA0205731.1 conserved hypothetical protein [Tenacibaculum maritimum]CAA0248263.1 conserved hypothetical protein [Tenacibaculum maritimum]